MSININNSLSEEKRNWITSSLKHSKDYINEELSNNLNYAKKHDNEEGINEDNIEEEETIEDEDDEEEGDDEVVNFFYFLKQEFSKWINGIIKWVQQIIWEPITIAQADYIKKVILQDTVKNFRAFNTIIDFFSINNNLTVTFDDVIKLVRLKPTTNNLINLAVLDEENICKISDFVNYVKNIEVLSDDITNKLETLNNLLLSRDYDINNWDIDFDRDEYILLKNVELSEELLEKIKYLINNRVSITLKDIISIDKKGIDDSLKGKIEQLKDTTYLHRWYMPILKKQKITDKLLENLTTIDDFDIPIYIPDLPELSKLNLTTEDIKKIQYVLKWTKDVYNYRVEDIYFIKSLTIEELKEIEKKSKKLGFRWFNNYTLKALHNISEGVFNYCVENNINNAADINKVKAMYSIWDRKSLKEYIQRKNNYLEENKLLSDEKFEEYFWWKWKYSKHEIYQWDIWLCYLYSWLQILKKMNGFDVLVQTNLKETDYWRMVRYPFSTWNWIKVNKDEIDKTVEIPWEDWKMHEVYINSIWDYQWFKILEIAYIKNKLLNMKQWWKKIKSWTGKEDNPYDIEINSKNLTKVEWWKTIRSLKELLWEESIYEWLIEANHIIPIAKRLEKCRAPENIVKNAKKHAKETENRIDKIFDLYWTGFISIELGVKPYDIPHWEWIRPIELDWVQLIIDNVNIVDKQWNPISKENLHIPDGTYTKEGPKIRIFPGHAYSVEKCYIDKNWEKRVWVVNPWHTDIKFDLSLDQCKRIFVWEFWVVNIDNLFR